MRYRKLGGSGIGASVVGFGAWAIGGWMWGGTNEGEAIRAIHAAIDNGINLIDTAPVYGFGTSEEIVGKAIRDRRDKVVLATKCGLVWNVEKGDFFFSSSDRTIGEEGGARQVYRYLGPESIRWEIEQSLKRLGTDRIDLYQTHWQESTTPIAETMTELMKLKAEGKIRAIGASNATPAQMDEYRRAGALDADQEPYSMLARGHETGNLPYCDRNNLAFLAYSPLAQGLLTGKMGPDRIFEEGDQRRGSARFSVENRQKVSEMLAEFKPITDSHQVTPVQLAIAWTAQQPGCTHVLAGARNPAQAVENAKAGDLVLSEEELALMGKAIANSAAVITW